MNKFKKIYAAVICLVLLISSSKCVTAENVIRNPLQLLGTNIEKGVTAFTITLQAKETSVLSAFEVCVEYDSDVFEVDDTEGVGYYFTEEFKTYFSNGYLCSNDKENQQVVFAGAKTGADAYTGEIGKIHFKIKDNITDTSAVIRLRIGSMAKETKLGIQEITLFDSIIGYRLVLSDNYNPTGDANLDGKLNMMDVQLILKSALGIKQLEKYQMEAVDFNLNGKAELEEAQTILKKVLKIR